MHTEDMMKKEKNASVEEEITELRAENCCLQEQLSRSEMELRRSQELLAGLREDRDKLRHKVVLSVFTSFKSGEMGVVLECYHLEKSGNCP